MAEAGCLEGEADWLDVGLHRRGRGSPSRERRSVGGPAWLCLLFETGSRYVV